jgi:hypothetical protein
MPVALLSLVEPPKRLDDDDCTACAHRDRGWARCWVTGTVPSVVASDSCLGVLRRWQVARTVTSHCLWLGLRTASERRLGALKGRAARSLRPRRLRLERRGRIRDSDQRDHEPGVEPDLTRLGPGLLKAPSQGRAASAASEVPHSRTRSCRALSAIKLPTGCNSSGPWGGPQSIPREPSSIVADGNASSGQHEETICMRWQPDTGVG